MHHYDKFLHSSSDPRPFSPAPPHGASLRMIAAMMEPDARRPARYVFEHRAAPRRATPFVHEARESHGAYFRRRSQEERAAAAAAASVAARDAHRELSLLYAQLSGPVAAVPERPQITDARARRQDALLDDALLETFPASDPVSVVLVS